MALLDMLDRARELGDARPSFNPKRRLENAADELDRAGTLQAQLDAMQAALVALTRKLYAIDSDGHYCNVDSATARILIAKPWGSSGWKPWGLRKWEADCLRRILIARCSTRRGIGTALFIYASDVKQWYLNGEVYPTCDSALTYIKDHSPTLAEWRAVTDVHRATTADRVNAHRGR